jgi:quercetin dioxygenase-like cupin family protein
MLTRIAVAVSLVALGAAPFSATFAESAAALKRVPVASIDLKRPQDVARVTLVELDYQPGEKVGMHLHPVPVLGYVQSGAFVVQLKGEPPRVYRKGEVVYEPADVVVLRYDNASATEPAVLIATYLAGQGQTELIRMLPGEPEP